MFKAWSEAFSRRNQCLKMVSLPASSPFLHEEKQGAVDMECMQNTLVYLKPYSI